jgi:hypothetical protein
MAGLRMKAVVNRDRLRTIEQALMVNAQDMAVMTRNVDSVFRQQEAELFASEGASGGAAWAKLSEPYASRKAGARKATQATNRWTKKLKLGNKFGPFMERAAGNKILQYTGNMMRSLTRAGHAQHVATFTGQGVKGVIYVGTTNALANYHWTGHGEPNPMPVRDPIQHKADQLLALLVPVRAYIRKKAERVNANMARFVSRAGG